ncbi:glycosyltransferase [Butyrivibrio sp. INlla16]|uniref:glycosyltransferase family 2 protein n=1 Tax=Butyrivibrio sp. INlla16 TaxID=1520807 RepID=UPI0008856E45|nr:glycosyltransferase [Butyrivibrio sp. INlla16]SDB36357.1 Glycosyltransferase involved in cell wall bisynthesis [Butyrivibrio sp. INlla16]
MKKVSIIIPVYNGANYIDEIFRQIGAQAYRELEVLLVDDGSTDDSGRVIREKIAEFEGDGIVFRLISQENTGQGGARNRGIAEASGDYLLFMDQDDHIREDYIERLLEVAERDGSDIVISGYEHVTAGGEVREHVELVNNEWCRFMNITPWGKIYRRDFVVREGIKFLPVPLGEDIYFNVLCYSHTRKVSYTEYVGYQWVINESSVSNTVHRSVSEEADVLRLFDAIAGMDSAGEWMKDEQFRYFMLKTGIFHVLYAAKGTPAGKLLEYRTDIFDWLERKMPGITGNRLIGWNSPVGERAGVRRAVFVFVMLRRMRLDGGFLRVFRLVG